MKYLIIINEFIKKYEGLGIAVMIILSLVATIVPIFMICDDNKTNKENTALIYTFREINIPNNDEVAYELTPTNTGIKILQSKLCLKGSNFEIEMANGANPGFLLKRYEKTKLAIFIDSIVKSNQCKRTVFPCLIKSAYYIRNKVYEDQSIYKLTVENGELTKYEFIKSVSNKLKTKIKIKENIECIDTL